MINDQWLKVNEIGLLYNKFYLNEWTIRIKEIECSINIVTGRQFWISVRHKDKTLNLSVKQSIDILVQI